MDQWEAIEKHYEWDKYTPIYSSYCTDGIIEPTETNPVTKGDLYVFTPLNDGTFEINARKDIELSGNLILPSTCKRKPVTVIGKEAFIRCEKIKSVKIPNSIIALGDGAFSSCTGLKSITIPESVTSIGMGAFYGCTNLKSITISNSVTSIGDRAFYGCGLTSVTIPNSVTSIGELAFYGCSGLTSVTIQNGVTRIDSRTF